jgi:hypothetical protein
MEPFRVCRLVQWDFEKLRDRPLMTPASTPLYNDVFGTVSFTIVV